MLSDDERERAARLAPGRAALDRRARGAADRARPASSAHPSDVELAAGPHGKPELPGSALRFNLSHSGDRALIALADGVEVGVDVERTSRRSRAIERTLTDGERAALTAATGTSSCCGSGAARRRSPRRAAAGSAGRRRRSTRARRAASSCRTCALDDGYVGALAVAGPPADVALYRVAF